MTSGDLVILTASLVKLVLTAHTMHKDTCVFLITLPPASRRSAPRLGFEEHDGRGRGLDARPPARIQPGVADQVFHSWKQAALLLASQSSYERPLLQRPNPAPAPLTSRRSLPRTGLSPLQRRWPPRHTSRPAEQRFLLGHPPGRPTRLAITRARRRRSSAAPPTRSTRPRYSVRWALFPLQSNTPEQQKKLTQSTMEDTTTATMRGQC